MTAINYSLSGHQWLQTEVGTWARSGISIVEKQNGKLRDDEWMAEGLLSLSLQQKAIPINFAGMELTIKSKINALVRRLNTGQTHLKLTGRLVLSSSRRVQILRMSLLQTPPSSLQNYENEILNSNQTS